MDKILALLQKCGYRRTIAATLAYLIEHQNQQSTSKSIEEETGLRQPEVTIAMKALVEKHWVVSMVAARPEDKRGPPTYSYILTDAEKVFDGISSEQQKNIIDIKSTLLTLRAAMIPAEKPSESQNKKELV